MAMIEIPTKRFMFRCSRPIEEQRPRQDPIIVMMAQRSSGFVQIPPLRDKSSMNARDILYNDLRKYVLDQEVGFQVDQVASLGDEFLKNLPCAFFF